MAKIRKVCAGGIGRTKLDKAVIEFLRHCRLRNLSPRTLEYYTENLEYFQRITAFTYTDEITVSSLEEFIGHEMDKGNRVTAINTRIRGLRVFIHFCADRDYMEDFKFPLLKEDETVKEPYTDAELRKLLRRPASNQWVEWRSWAIVNTLLATGIRANTLINLHVGDLDFQHNTVFLSKLKNRKQQTIPMSETLKTALTVYLKMWEWRSEDFLFPTLEGKQMAKGSLQCAMRAYNLRRGVSKTSLHLFRHTFAKNYILAGGGMVQLQALLGHSTLDMTRKYIRLYSQDIQRDFERLNPLNTILQKDTTQIYR